MDTMPEEDMYSTTKNRVVEWYNGKTVFITGGTGFMGKVLVEKLLRVCTGIHRIYLLMRSKKGKDPNERLKEMFNNPLYDTLRKLHGDEMFKKVIAIAGDVLEPDMGLSEKDRGILSNEVQIIFHGAATIRFDDSLKRATLINVRGTKFMMDLAKQCKKLLVFLHVSTAYCHLGERVLYEKAYPPPTDPYMMIKTVEWMDEEVVNSITDKLLGDCPNTYAFTKALGESIVVDHMDELPIVIMRPSVVVPIWLEPLPGWTDNINGPTGLLIGAGKGVIRTMYCDQKGYADYLPVDIAVNGLLLASWDRVHFKIRKYYNMTSSFEYKVSWEEVINIGRKLIETKMPLNGVVWYPGGSMKTSKLLHNICVVLFHYIPAIFLDGLIILCGHKPVLWRVQQRITKGFEVFDYYANKQWDFNNDGSLVARDLMNDLEQKTFKVDGLGLNVEEYFLNCIHAARLYILKETDDTLPAARRHMMVMWIVDRLCKLLFFVGMGYLVYNHFIRPAIGST